MNPYGPHNRARVRRFLAAMAAFALAGGASTALGQDVDLPPSIYGLAPEVRGFARHGETIGAALACKLRSQDWAESYRSRLVVAMQARAPGAALEGARAVTEREAFAQRQATRSPRQYCSFGANPADLAIGDRIVSGAQTSLP
jgi:hypothetical protein